MSETGKVMPTLVEEMKMLEELHGERKLINSELWHACAGPLVTLPQPGSLVYYFPQGHSEQVTASTKKIAKAHIPSYPGLPSQMMCQVHNITLHADKQTDEIYAKMILQPVNSENDVLRIPDFGLTKSKQPTEFFCKTLTPSDTSTHGGFSVPRRAAEKLFPQLDYSMQPPNQELVIKDMHDNTWNFRHIYRGQPKRHLLTTGWSVFVGTKQLKAGDSVLFIRGERSQLMLGIRRANHQQTMPPSSVLSADSMHIGVLAAAAHAAANRSQFTIYYNPRASPSEFVVPLAKYHRAAYGMQVSIGMRFGMMFETECSSKRRYTGTVVGISDSDPFRWPNSKWRNLQVEWDDSGCVERSNRVSLWELETPDNRFGFPSSATSLKRPHTGILGWESMTRRPYLHTQENTLNPNPVVPNLVLHGLMSTYMKPDSLLSIAQTNSEQAVRLSILQNIKQEESWMTSSIMPACYGASYQLPQEAGDGNLRHISVKNSPREDLEKSNLVKPVLVTHSDAQQLDNGEGSLSAVIDNSPNRLVEQSNNISSSMAEKAFRKVNDGKSLETYPQITDQLDEHSQLLLEDGVSMAGSLITENASSQIPNDIPSVPRHGSFHAVQAQQFDTETGEPMHFYTTETDVSDYNSSQYTDAFGRGGCSSFPLDLKPPEYGNGFSNPADISAIVNLDNSVPIKTEEFLLSCETSVAQSPVTFADELFGSQLSNSLRDIPLLDEPSEEHYFSTQKEFTTLQNFGLKDFPEDTSSLNELYPSFGFDYGSGSMIGDPSISCTSHEAFGATCNSSITFPSQGIKCKVSSFQDVQSQVTSASLTDFSVQEFHDTSNNTSPSDMAGLGNSLSKRGSRKQSRSLRTYTKVQKLGSVGRSIDVTRFTNYKELRSAIGTMFGLQQQLNDPKVSGWKLVYIDYENDVLLVGDDPWEEFIGCVRCIRILSPTEVQRMGNEDIQLRGNSFAPKIDQCSVP